LRFCNECNRRSNGKHTGQHDGFWRGSAGHATPRACCAVHIRQRASAQCPYHLLTPCPRHERSKLSLSGLEGQQIRTDERTRRDDGGRCTSSSRNVGPWWVIVVAKLDRVRLGNVDFVSCAWRAIALYPKWLVRRAGTLDFNVWRLRTLNTAKTPSRTLPAPRPFTVAMGHAAGLRAGTRYAFSRGFKNKGMVRCFTACTRMN
jgi:hypothetical protein